MSRVQKIVVHVVLIDANRRSAVTLISDAIEAELRVAKFPDNRGEFLARSNWKLRVRWGFLWTPELAASDYL
jgi:hypothetical protein